MIQITSVMMIQITRYIICGTANANLIIVIKDWNQPSLLSVSYKNEYVEMQNS